MSTKSIAAVAQEADEQEQRADEKRIAYLRGNGWSYTSDTPGCRWMWCKEWRGKQWTYGRAADALRAESWFQEMGEQG